jgi:hypothetical protein
LKEDKSAELHEPPPSELGAQKGAEHITKGNWSIDDSKRYLITMDAVTTPYLLFSHDDVATCMLVKGEMASVNLRESWFSRDLAADSDAGSND